MYKLFPYDAEDWKTLEQKQLKLYGAATTMSIQLISKHNLCCKKGVSQPLEERIQGLGRTITFPWTLRVAMVYAILWVFWETVAMAACGLLATTLRELKLYSVISDACDEENAKFKYLFEEDIEVWEM